MFVATAAVCAVLLSTPNVVQVEAEAVIAASVANLRGNQRTLISTDRHLEGGGGGQNGEGKEGQEGEEKGEQGEQKDEQQQEQQAQQYQEGNNNDGNEEEVEEEADQEEQQEEEAEAEEEYEYEAEDAYEGDDGQVDDDQSSVVSNVQETVADAQVKFETLMNRFDEDVVQMWSTSPSEWDDEFWKVFGIVAGVFTLLLSCIFYLFCLCCKSEKDENVIIKREKRNHRGRLFTRDRTNDTDTIGTHHTGRSSIDYDRPFVLIEDVEKDDDQTAGDMTGALSPLSSKTEGVQDYSVSGRPTTDDETQFSKATFRSSKSKKSLKKNPSGGIINETVDVWSEFLGFKKSKYNVKPTTKSKDEDDDIDLTDDEALRRKKRSSSSKNSDRGGPMQMRTGTYVRPTGESDVDEVDPIVSNTSTNSGNNSSSRNDRLTVQTPVMSNVMHNEPRSTKNNSPRRTALIKTKNLLRSFGANNNINSKNRRNSKNIDPKEQSLLTNP